MPDLSDSEEDDSDGGMVLYREQEKRNHIEMQEQLTKQPLVG